MGTKKVWWFHLAQIGHSVGVGIGAAAGLAMFVPGPWSVAIGAVAGVATIVTHYADSGIVASNAS